MTAATAPVRAPVRSARWALALAALLGAAGVTHLVSPGTYEGIIPHLLPGSRLTWALLSGMAELACCALLLWPASRRVGATVAAILFVAVFPANIQMAVDWRHRAVLDQVIAWGRLPLQVPLVWWALHVRATASPSRWSPTRHRRR